MGKEAELWDDSALLNAFDDAMSKYKIMHGKGYHDGSTEGGKGISSTGENVFALVDEGHDAKRHLEADDNSNVASNTTTEMEETNKPSPTEENRGVDSNDQAGQGEASSKGEPYIDSLTCLNAQDALKGYSNSQGVEDYTQLLSQYYELEEKRQQILQQLHQIGSCNYQCSAEGSGSGVQWGTFSTTQDQVPTSQACNPTVACSCCPYLCPYMVAPCTSMPVCSLDGTCVGQTSTNATATMIPGKSWPLEDDNIVKTAIGAAEKAISSMKMKTSEKEKDDKCEGKMAEGTSFETDLADVLNAWYSAGFYTGKYLMEQSIAKKRHE